MSETTFIALRYLKASKQDRFFSWISLLTITGITIGVTTMIVVLSVISGFEDELRERFLAANSHIMIYRFPAGLKNHERWEKIVAENFADDITGVSPFIHSDTMGRKDYLIHAVLIKGYDPKKRQNVQNLSNLVRPKEALNFLEEEINNAQDGSLALPKIPSIILGQGLFSLMKAQIGDQIELISPSQDTSDPFSEMEKFIIRGVYDSGLQYLDNKMAILSIPAAQQLFHMGDLVTGLEVGLKNPYESVEIAEKMEERYSEVSIKEWQSYNRSIFEAMAMEKITIAFIVALVAFVASFNILTTLFISVTQKRRDIAILKALGSTNWQILSIFIKQSLWMGIIGSFVGVLFALSLAKTIETFPFIRLPDIYMIESLPVSYDIRVYIGISLGAILIAGLAGIYPAWVAAKTLPTEGLQEGGGNN